MQKGRMRRNGSLKIFIKEVFQGVVKEEIERFDVMKWGSFRQFREWSYKIWVFVYRVLVYVKVNSSNLRLCIGRR